MRCKLLGMPSGWFGCVPRIESRMAQARVLQIIGERDAVGVAGRSGYGMVARMAAAVALIGAGEARNRVAAAEALAPRQSLIGETLPPRCPATAAAFAAGEISSAAVRIVTDAMRRIPAGVHPRPRSSRPWPGMPAGSNPGRWHRSLTGCWRGRRPDTDPAGPDQRTPPQRNGNALVEACSMLLDDAVLPTAAGQRPPGAHHRPATAHRRVG